MAEHLSDMINSFVECCEFRLLCCDHVNQASLTSVGSLYCYLKTLHMLYRARGPFNSHRLATSSQAFCGGSSKLRKVSLVLRVPTDCCRKQSQRQSMGCAGKERRLAWEAVQSASHHCLIMRTGEEEEAGPQGGPGHWATP